jgi:hypothetical protein
MEQKQPQYTFWAIQDIWSLDTAALLLNGIDPLTQDSECLFTTIEALAQDESMPLTTAMSQAITSYFILRDVDWGKYDSNIDRLHPYVILREAYNRYLIAEDDELFILLNERHQRETGKKLIELASDITQEQELPLSARERDSFLRLVGALAVLYWRKRAPHSAEKINQSTLIAEIITQFPNMPGLSQRTLEAQVPLQLPRHDFWDEVG